jgi:hypothetical protein
MTDREMMGLHAEILSLRDRLGISYKDASHRLYMTEWKKLKNDERTHKAFSILTGHTRDALVSFQTRLGELGGLQEQSTGMDDDADVNANADADVDNADADDTLSHRVRCAA